jgi:hypothetical protein
MKVTLSYFSALEGIEMSTYYVINYVLTLATLQKTQTWTKKMHFLALIHINTVVTYKGCNNS